jgi:Ca2+-binding RTX toxin-like protein
VTIGASINGGAGKGALVVNGGGTVAMGASITGIKTVTLASATVFTANGLNLTITGGKKADTITAGSGTDVITGGGGADILIAGTGADTFKDTTTNLTLDTIEGFGVNDVIDLKNLKPSASKPTTATWSSAGGGTLTVAQGSSKTLIKLPGAFAGTFTASADGAGGTDIRYSATPARSAGAFAQAMAGIRADETAMFGQAMLTPRYADPLRPYALAQP